MPHRKRQPPPRATLRQLRTVECHLAHYQDRDKAFMNGLEHLEAVLKQGLPDSAIVKQLQQAQYELRTALEVAQRMHELRMQELQTTAKFPDENGH